jgi:hypothetical protein
MAKSIRDIPKKRSRGRPKTTGRGEAILLRLHPPLLTHLDEWISERSLPSRPEAIRRLLEVALSPAKGKRPSSDAAKKATTLATNAADHLVDKSAAPEEQQRRKRRLIRGPSEFREIRRDQPKRQG